MPSTSSACMVFEHIVLSHCSMKPSMSDGLSVAYLFIWSKKAQRNALCPSMSQRWNMRCMCSTISNSGMEVSWLSESSNREVSERAHAALMNVEPDCWRER